MDGLSLSRGDIGTERKAPFLPVSATAGSSWDDWCWLLGADICLDTEQGARERGKADRKFKCIKHFKLLERGK